MLDFLGWEMEREGKEGQGCDSTWGLSWEWDQHNRSCFLRLPGFPLLVPFPISQLSLALTSLVTQEIHCPFWGKEVSTPQESPMPTFIKLAHESFFFLFFKKNQVYQSFSSVCLHFELERFVHHLYFSVILVWFIFYIQILEIYLIKSEFNFTLLPVQVSRCPNTTH